MNNKQNAQPNFKIPIYKKLLFALCTTILVFTAIELTVRVFIGAPHPPLLAKIPNGTGDWIETSNGTVQLPYQNAFPIPPFPLKKQQKPRVFFIGGSSLHGGAGKIFLEDEAPAIVGEALQIEAINLAAPGLDSNHLVELLREALTLSPDAVVIYTGHNDIGNTVFMEKYGNDIIIITEAWLRKFKTFEILQTLIRTPSPLPKPKPKLQNLLTSQKREMIRDNFKKNLLWMIRMAKKAEVKLVLVTPTSNVRSPPLEWTCPEPMIQLGIGKNPRGHRIKLPSMLKIDGQEWANLDTSCRDVVWAKAESEHNAEILNDLRDNAPLAVRADSKTIEVVREVAAQNNIPLADAALEFKKTEDGIEPLYLFVDPVHFSKRGHQALASVITPVLAEALDLENPDLAMPSPPPKR